jgi:hypothetical protein
MRSAPRRLNNDTFSHGLGPAAPPGNITRPADPRKFGQSQPSATAGRPSPKVVISLIFDTQLLLAQVRAPKPPPGAANPLPHVRGATRGVRVFRVRFSELAKFCTHA